MLHYGQMVRLNPKAIKNFYGTQTFVDMYPIGGDMDLFDNGCFVQFVADYNAFYNGQSAGLVYCKGSDHNVYGILYFSNITGKWNLSYFEEDNLQLIK